MDLLEERMEDLIPIEQFSEAQIAANRVFDEWNSKHILAALKNCTPLELGKIINEIHCGYAGRNHSLFCSYVTAHFITEIIKSFEGEL